MKYRSLGLLLLTFLLTVPALTQTQSLSTPLTNQELVQLVYQLPAHPERKEALIDEIRRRGIGFPLTDGLRALVASKSGNDASLRRALEEAERRRLNPVVSSLPPESEGEELISKTRNVTLAAAGAMPDFIVKQIITRSVALGNSQNWAVSDHLTVAVSYRANAGEEYRVLSVNGMPSTQTSGSQSYEQMGGTTSTGEYVSMLADLFDPASRTTFKMVDTDVLRGRRTIVYEYEIQKQFSKQMIKASGFGDNQIITGYRGRVWIDRELYRVLRLEDVATDIPSDFPVSAASSMVDYDWVTINEHQYLLPSRAEITLAARANNRQLQTRNEIRFRGYQKFGSDVRIIEDVPDDDEPPSQQTKQPAQPASSPQRATPQAPPVPKPSPTP